MHTLAKKSKTTQHTPAAAARAGSAATGTQQTLNGLETSAGPHPAHPAMSQLLLRRIATQSARRTLVQAKLTVSSPTDSYEQEAESVAQRVMRMNEPPAHGDGAAGEHGHATAERIQTKSVQDNDAAGMEAPPIVHDALNASGRPLDVATRGFMEPRFGHDFSNVRVHTDSSAAAAAHAVQARAFTSGRDIVFGAGEYAPGTTEGKSLLAHELTHVVQQGGGGQLPNGTVQRRSFLGGILGAIGGAIAGAVVGAFVGGPVGAIVGGVLGAIGGGLLGDRLTQRRRHLTEAEKKYAREIFKDTIDYSKVVITRDSLLSAGAPKTIGNTIHLKSNWGEFVGDTMDLSERGKLDLIHEMGHVWQYQNGGLAYIPKSLWAQLKAAIGQGTRNAAYDWHEAHNAGIPWAKWNPEQQADAIENYNRLLRLSQSNQATLSDLSELATLTTYMQKVWNREGAPRFFH